MKPFYSVDDLEEMFDFATPENIADALRAANVPMIFCGEPADLKGWHRQRARRDDTGALRVFRGAGLDPDPSEVMVAYEQLPDSWRRHIDALESGETPAALEQPAGSEKPLSNLREKSLLRIIKALMAMADIPNRGAAVAIEKKLQELGFQSPRDDTITGVLSSAHKLDPDS